MQSLFILDLATKTINFAEIEGRMVNISTTEFMMINLKL